MPAELVPEVDFDDLKLEPFALVLEAGAAGSHDGSRMSIDVRSLTDPVVAYHEGIHQRIFIGTPDGQVLSALLELLALKREWGDPSKTFLPLPPTVAPLARHLLRHSRFAHEAAATYASITRYSPGPGARVYERLPGEYKNYYHSIADVIDQWVESGLIKRLFTQGIWTLVFDSPYLARLVDASLEDPPEPTIDELPDERFKRLREVLCGVNMSQLSTKISEMVEPSIQRVRQRGFDPDDNRVTDLLENSSMQPIVAYLRQEFIRLSTLSSLSHEMRHAPILKRFSELLAPYNFTAFVEQEGAEGAARTHSFWQSKSMFTNPQPLPCTQEDDRELQGDAAFDSSVEFQILSAEPPNQMKRWMFLGFQATQTTGFGGYFSTNTVLDWLTRCTERERTGRHFPRARAITVAVRSVNQIEDFQQTLMRCVGIRRDGYIRGRSTGVVVWYWYRGWAELFTQLDGMGPLRTMSIRITKPEGPKDELEPAVIIKILSSPYVQGYIIRVLSTAAAKDLELIEMPMYESGKIARFEADLAPSASYAARNSFQLIMDYWSRY